MDILERDIPKRCTKLLHVWQTIDPNVVAEGQKGTRAKIFVRGAYQECRKCHEGRFVPTSRELSVVGCERHNAPKSTGNGPRSARWPKNGGLLAGGVK